MKLEFFSSGIGILKEMTFWKNASILVLYSIVRLDFDVYTFVKKKTIVWSTVKVVIFRMGEINTYSYTVGLKSRKIPPHVW